MSEDISDLIGATGAEPVENAAADEFAQSELPAKRVPSPTDVWVGNNSELLKWMRRMKNVPTDGVDDLITNQTYAAAVWRLREAALSGDFTATRAIEIWLKWAKEVLKRPRGEDRKPSKASIAFAPREPEKEDDES